MVEYSLLKLSGDKDLDGKSTAIIGWSGKYNEEEMYLEVVDDVMQIKMEGITSIDSEYDGSLSRWIITVHAVSNDVVVTVDKIQKKVVLVTENENILTLFRIVERVMNCGYDKDISYRASKVFGCMLKTFKMRVHRG